MSIAAPMLERVTHREVTVWTDPALADVGIIVAFTERTGGVSAPPYDSLNLAAHVGDDPAAVDENRRLLLSSLGLGTLRARLVTAEQVHGASVRVVDDADAGRGAFAVSGASRAPIAGTDGLVVSVSDIPLLLLYADCVPVVLVANRAERGVAVLHAGWRGALARIPQRGVQALCAASGTEPSMIRAYIGPHIGSCCYKVSTSLVSDFRNEFDTIFAVDGRLDLDAVVTQSLCDGGIAPEMIARVGECTLDSTDWFYSYRSAQVTGRHGALAVVTKAGA